MESQIAGFQMLGRLRLTPALRPALLAKASGPCQIAANKGYPCQQSYVPELSGYREHGSMLFGKFVVYMKETGNPCA